MKVIVKVRYGNISGNPDNVNQDKKYPGHVWLEVYNDANQLVLITGFEPTIDGMKGGEIGLIQANEDDGGGVDYVSDAIQISPAQYQQLQGFMNRTQDQEYMYSPLGGNEVDSFNCTTWVRQALREMGMDVPASTLDFLPTRFPEVFMPPDTGGDPYTGMPWPGVTVPDRPIWIRDPLVLDLDGDGIELTNENGSVMFDYGGDGVKSSTGWVGRDDGLLVRDLNGNGQIDNGRELFGVDTVKPNGELAFDGFDALSPLDSNADGVFNQLDAEFNNLKIWRDANGNGVTDAGELKSLTEQGIASIGLSSSASGQIVAGNTIDRVGHAGRSNGGTTTVAAVNFAVDYSLSQFYQSPTGPIQLTAFAQTLPNIRGAGTVRNLAEAASLNTTEGAALVGALQAFLAATDRQQRLQLLGDVIKAWSKTSTQPSDIDLNTQPYYDPIVPGETVVQAWKRQNLAQYEMVNALEKFYGTNIIATNIVQFPGTSLYRITNWPDLPGWDNPIRAAWDGFLSGVLTAIDFQQTAHDYLPYIQIALGPQGVTYDLSLFNSKLDALRTTDEVRAFSVLLDLAKTASSTFEQVGFDAYGVLATWISQLSASSPVHQLLNDRHVTGSSAANGTRKEEIILATAGNDYISGNSGHDVLIGLGGNDRLDGGTGNDRIEGGEGDDVLDGGTGNDTLLGGNGADNLSGGTGKNLINGGAGNDRILHSGGEDTILFQRGDGQDEVVGLVDGQISSLHFGPGIRPEDIEVRQLFNGSFVDGGFIELSIRGTSDKISIEAQADQLGLLLNLIRFEDGTEWTPQDLQQRIFNGHATSDTVRGTAGDDEIFGLAGDDVIYGWRGADVLRGGDGNDVLYGGWSGLLDGDGNDVLDGGSGNDVLVASFGSNVYVFDRGYGHDVIQADYNNSSKLPGDVSVVRLGPSITPDDVVFYDYFDVVTGSKSGISMHLRDNTADSLLIKFFFPESENESYRSPVDKIEFGDGSVWNREQILNAVRHRVVGTAGDDELVAFGGGWWLHGGAGNDLLRGGWGSDWMYGEEGADVMRGGEGDDFYFVDDVGDQVVEAAGQGWDHVESTVDWTLGANVESLQLVGQGHINGTGNELANSLIGNDGNNRLDGKGGADLLTGYGGNDTYGVDDVGDELYEEAGGGTDTVESSITWTLGTEFENITLVGTAAIDAVGNGKANVMTGNDAANRLDGGAGNDTMSGGKGDDTYIVGATGDVVTERVNEGIDTVISSVNHTLGANVENLTLTGSAATGTGNGLANVLVGTAGANTLSGGAGNDTLDGGLGNDVMNGGAGDDVFVVNATGDVTNENANDGIDLVRSAVTWTLGTNLENLTLTGSSAVNGTGNASANVLIGNAGANTLSGLAGADLLDGGAGADLLQGGAGADTYVFGLGYGLDTIQDSDSTAGVKDKVQLGAGLSASNVSFSRSGNNLVLNAPGGTDKLTVKDWYLGTQHQVEEFVFSDGQTLTNVQAQALVSAMAQFSAGQIGDELGRAAHDAWSGRQVLLAASSV